MLVQNIEVQLVGPPVSVRPAPAGCLWVWCARYRVLSVVGHNAASFRRVNFGVVPWIGVADQPSDIQLKSERVLTKNHSPIQIKKMWDAPPYP
jgi:hypothetical protein